MSTDTVTVPTSAVHSRTFGGLRGVLTTAGVARGPAGRGHRSAGHGVGGRGAGEPQPVARARGPVPVRHARRSWWRVPRRQHQRQRPGEPGGERHCRDVPRHTGECAVKAVGKSLWRNRKKPTLPTVALGTIKPGVKCGRSKGY